MTGSKHPRRALRSPAAAVLAAVSVAAFGWVGGEPPVRAAPINPAAFKAQFEQARKSAEVVARVRVLTAVCTAAGGKASSGVVTLQLALQVLEVDKGPVKRNDLVVVSREVTPPAGPGPRSYAYMAAVRQFPLTPGVRGAVALRWDKEQRRYVALAGWVPEPNGAPIPTEVGKALVAGATGKAR
jgi:hypothetical protein